MGERSIAGGMRPNRHSLDEDSAARLLQGAVHPDDAPPGYASVADLLATAASLPAVGEDAGAATIAAMVEAVRNCDPVPVPETGGRKSVLGKLFAGKALAAIATVALTAGGAAAATGTLPAPVQGAVADAVSHIGIDLPDNHNNHPHGKAAGDSADNDANDATTSTTGGSEGGDNEGTGAVDDAGKGEVISGITHDPALDGQPKGPTVCAEASDDRCRAGQDHSQNSGSGEPENGNGSTNSGEGSQNSGQGGANSGRDVPAPPAVPANRGAGEDHPGVGPTTTVTTEAPTPTTAEGGIGASANSSNGRGKGQGQGRSGATN